MLARAPVTRVLVLICMLVYLVGLAAGQYFEFAASLIPARLTGYATLNGAVPAPLTLVTSLFLHADIGHLGLNMVFFVFIGRVVEPLLGGGRFAALYFASGVAGGLAQVAAEPLSIVPVVGASGAVGGIFAAYAMIFGQRDGGQSELRRGLQLALFWIGLQLAIGYVFNAGNVGGIAIWAHVGGFLAGLVLALPLVKDAIRSR